MPAKSIMKVAKSQTETRSSKLSLNKMPAKVGKPAAKDPKKPKRPGGLPPDLITRRNILIKKIVAAVGKAGGSKWKSLSGSEKAPYVAKADKRKVEYKDEHGGKQQGIDMFWF
ncbi:high mobility group B protein 3 isoform X2 [Brassica napus]|uniref:high mobility group B protein 3 isoform X2 n=1 Tax=Brassica napus TaxID=3708 RepID=UPI0006AA900E|nr:high mobility group B protein 3 isoform X2 [Brassica napus]